MSPFMLIMRNEPMGMIWQAYTVENETEAQIITKNAQTNGFLVTREPVGYTDESTPGWRDTEEWKACLAINKTKKENNEKKS